MLDEMSPASWLVVGSHDLRSAVRRPSHWQVTLLECPAAALAPAVDGALSYTLDLRGWPDARALVLGSDGSVTERAGVCLQVLLDQDWNLPIGLLRSELPSLALLQPYPQVDLHQGHARFLRLPGGPSARRSAVPDLLAGIDEHFLKIANHRCFQVKLQPDVELEHKFTLTGHPDVFALARNTLRLVSSGGLPGFKLEFREEIQEWDFLNHVYAIEQPVEEAGYVSFIPTTDGRYTVKRKIYTEDADERIELRNRHVEIATDFETYLHDVMSLTPAWSASFRRVRYDVFAEAIDSGNVIAITYDRSIVIDPSGHRIPTAPELTQCEMEYAYSVALSGANYSSVRQDLDRLRVLMNAYFDEHQIENYQRHESKLTWLRNQHARLS